MTNSSYEGLRVTEFEECGTCSRLGGRAVEAPVPGGAGASAFVAEVLTVEDPKALEIIRMFAEGKNAAEVAKVLGYGSHNSVNQYMRRRGYQWDPRLRNYIKKDSGNGNRPAAAPGPVEVMASKSGGNGEKPTRSGDCLAVLEEVEDREAVRELLRRAPDLLRLLRSVETPASRLGIRPRERSRPEVTKGFRIAVELDRRLEQFCAEHGVMQKDVIETALWEFLESRAGA